jgi:hypothetical protein
MTTSNIITSLMPTFFKALVDVNNEWTDEIDAVYMNQSLEQAAMNQTITYPISLPKSTYTIASQALPLDINGETPGTGTMSINNIQAAAFKYTGEEQRQLALGGISMKYLDDIKECLRAIRNAVSASVITAMNNSACRAIGTAGTTPFAFNGTTTSGMDMFGDVTAAMIDNGCPTSDVHMILGGLATGALLKVPNLFRANEAGSDRQLRTGAIGKIEIFNVGSSSNIMSKHTTGGSSTTTSAAYALPTGGKSRVSVNISVASSAGYGAGDLIVNSTADATRQYVVIAVPDANTLTLAAPGPLVAWGNGDTIVATGKSGAGNPFIQNFAFQRNSVHLIARQPQLPTGIGGTGAGITGAVGTLVENRLLPDTRTGLIYQLCAWSEHRQIVVEVGLAWGVGVPNPQNLFVVLG